jgi:hypothetical protein
VQQGRAANLPRSGKVVWFGEVAGSMRAGALPGERKLLRRTPLWVQSQTTAMHPIRSNLPVLPVLSVRVDETNLDHHLWCNHGVWWIHYVVHEGNRKRRVRHSLRTRDVEVARRLRDTEFALVRDASVTACAAPGIGAGGRFGVCA